MLVRNLTSSVDKRSLSPVQKLKWWIYKTLKQIQREKEVIIIMKLRAFIALYDYKLPIKTQYCCRVDFFSLIRALMSISLQSWICIISLSTSCLYSAFSSSNYYSL